MAHWHRRMAYAIAMEEEVSFYLRCYDSLAMENDGSFIEDVL
jgi:hypothetical protein